MSERLPLFPLGTVLFPGLVLPLHIFEERYRQLVHELLDGPEPRRFGVIAIRKGRETGDRGRLVAVRGRLHRDAARRPRSTTTAAST
jgi:Lon protease-like protein